MGKLHSRQDRVAKNRDKGGIRSIPPRSDPDKTPLRCRIGDNPPASKESFKIGMGIGWILFVGMPTDKSYRDSEGPAQSDSRVSEVAADAKKR